MLNGKAHVNVYTHEILYILYLYHRNVHTVEKCFIKCLKNIINK